LLNGSEEIFLLGAALAKGVGQAHPLENPANETHHDASDVGVLILFGAGHGLGKSAVCW